MPALVSLTSRPEAECARAFRDAWTPFDEPHLEGKPLHGVSETLARFLAALVRLLEPETALEVGVGQGVSSAAILRAMEENERGVLHSFDRPVVRENERAFIGFLVARGLRERWVLQVGGTEELLPRVIRELGSVDLFFDGSGAAGHHYAAIWDAVRPGGTLLARQISPQLMAIAERSGQRLVRIDAGGPANEPGALRKPWAQTSLNRKPQ